MTPSAMRWPRRGQACERQVWPLPILVAWHLLRGAPNFSLIGARRDFSPTLGGAGVSTSFTNLRIAYFTEWSPYRESGVLKKLVGQVEAWRELGADARLFSLATSQDCQAAGGYERVGTVHGRLSERALRDWPALRLGYANKLLTARDVRKAIKEYRPDLIYYRQQGPWYPGLESILRVAPSVMELNTDDFSEMKLWHPLLGSLLAATQTRLFARMAGFIAVTEEIASRWRRFGKPTDVVPNSFWGEQPPALAASGNSVAKFVFVGSRLPRSGDWHGVDKILAFARLVPNREIHVIGLSAGEFDGSSAPANVVFHGRQDSAGVGRIFSSCDVGLGSMALHRTNLSDACPLKVRDYLMHRMPIVIAYREAEHRLNQAPFVLRLPNEEGNLVAHADRVVEFGNQWCNRRVEIDLSFMSRRAIERRRLEFLSRLA